MKNKIEIKGRVIKGDGYGRKLGFPTVNLENLVKDVPSGVYSGKGIINSRTYRAAIVINQVFKIEAHLLGYRGDAYGKVVVLKIEKFLREFKKFPTEKELIVQIGKDLKKC